MMKTMFRRTLAALGLIAIAGAAPAKPVAKPALWAVTDADTTVYLFGTIHLLPQNYQWRSAKLDQAAEVELLQVLRARLQHHLVLVVMAEAVGVLAIAAVGWPTTRLNVGAPPRVGPKRPQHRRGVERPRPHFHVIGLQQNAALRAPIAVERKDQVLETQAQADVPRWRN